MLLRRDSPDYRWNMRLPLATRRTAPSMHDGGNVVRVCGDACKVVAVERNLTRQALSNEAHEAVKPDNKPATPSNAKLAACAWCGETFTAQRRTATYCGDSCRGKARRAGLRVLGDD